MWSYFAVLKVNCSSLYHLLFLVTKKVVKLSLQHSVGRTEQRAATDHEVEFVIINRCSVIFSLAMILNREMSKPWPTFSQQISLLCIFHESRLTSVTNPIQVNVYKLSPPCHVHTEKVEPIKACGSLPSVETEYPDTLIAGGVRFHLRAAGHPPDDFL